MKFNLKGWSVFYKTAEGSGRVTCNNGEKANVKINVTGGGLTFGKMDIRDGNGTFSEVIHIDEIFGSIRGCGSPCRRCQIGPGLRLHEG